LLYLIDDARSNKYQAKN